MAATSIRHMNITLVAREQIADAYYQTLKPAKSETYYWHVERKAKRGNKWIFVARFFCTKAEMARLWITHYCHLDVKHRLVHMMRY